MDQPHPSLPRPPADRAVVQQEQGQQERLRRRQPYVPPPAPPMRTVTKGWWVLREGETTVEELAKARRERQ